jgi:hypothetical protein
VRGTDCEARGIKLTAVLLEQLRTGKRVSLRAMKRREPQSEQKRGQLQGSRCLSAHGLSLARLASGAAC